MPPLWWVQEHLELTSDHPSGLKWKTSDRHHDAGDVAGILRTDGRFYVVSLLGLRYPVHRVVYYLRTGVDPGDADVIHDKDNISRDNRLNLTLYKRRTRPAPKYRRRVRDEEGNLVFREPHANYRFIDKGNSIDG